MSDDEIEVLDESNDGIIVERTFTRTPTEKFPASLQVLLECVSTYSGNVVSLYKRSIICWLEGEGEKTSIRFGLHTEDDTKESLVLGKKACKDNKAPSSALALGRIPPFLASRLWLLLREGYVACSGKVINALSPLRVGSSIQLLLEMEIQTSGGSLFTPSLTKAAKEAGKCMFDMVHFFLYSKLPPPIIPIKPPSKKEEEQGEELEQTEVVVDKHLVNSAFSLSGSTSSSSSSPSSFSQTLTAANIAFSLNQSPQPDGLSCTLRPYQIAALSWMRAREKGMRAKQKVPLGERQVLRNGWVQEGFSAAAGVSKSFFYLHLTQHTLSLLPPPPPQPANGGVLADEMGLGKTVQLLACIVKGEEEEGGGWVRRRRSKPCDRNKKRSRYGTGADFDDSVGENDEGGWEGRNEEDCEEEGSSSDESNGGMIEGMRTSNATLIVVPLSLMSQWVGEIEKYASGLIVRVYYGAGRKQSSLRKSHVVITTYGTVISEFGIHEKRRAVEEDESEELVASSRPVEAARKGKEGKKTGVNSDVVVCGGIGKNTLGELNLAKFGFTVGSSTSSSMSTSFKGPTPSSSSSSSTTTSIAAPRAHTVAEKTAPCGSSLISPLFSTHFRRVALDEAHVIKNPDSLGARACTSLSASYRWCLTGTPICNTLVDLYSLLRFLRHEPFSDPAYFKSTIMNPLSELGTSGRPEPGALDALRSLVGEVVLRRTKGMLDIDGKLMGELPAIDNKIIDVALTPPEREFYDCLYGEASRKFFRIESENALKRSWALVMTLLLRLRQASVHPVLCLGARELDFDVVTTTGRSEQLSGWVDSGTAVAGREDNLGDTQKTGSDTETEEEVEVEEGKGSLVVGKEVSGIGKGGESEGGGDELHRGLLLRLYERCVKATNAAGAASSKNPTADRESPVDSAYVDGGKGFYSSKLLAVCLYVERITDHNSTTANVIKNFPPGKGGRPVKKQVLDLELDGWEGSHPFQSGEGGFVEVSPPKPTGLVIFSSWTSCLDLIQDMLMRKLGMRLVTPGFVARSSSRKWGKSSSNKKSDTKVDETNSLLNFAQGQMAPTFARLDGSSSNASRECTLSAFLNDPSCNVLLLSIKAGGCGLNLQNSANVAILLEPWWNPAVEAQAWGRIHRMGQQRTVYIRRLRSWGTVEERIFGIQEQKARLSADALSEEGSSATDASNSSLTLDQIRSFFGGERGMKGEKLAIHSSP